MSRGRNKNIIDAITVNNMNSIQYFLNRKVHGMRLKQWKDFKSEKDWEDNFNPKKLDGIFLMKMVINLALWFEPIVRILGNTVKSELKERWEAKNHAFNDCDACAAYR